MSRIHEALRRAAEEKNANAERAANTPAPVDGEAITALAREPFPVELGTARHRRQSDTQATAAQQTEFTDETTGGEDEGSPRRHTIFERIDARLAEKVVADDNMSPVSREQYRRLAGVLLDAQGNNGVRVIMVASAVPGEGKTLTATNLALTLSESYRRRVLLIDADLRKPTVHEVFRINAATGLVEGLDPQTGSKLVVRQVSTNLAVLPAGRPTSDPMAALTSDRMRHLLDEARASFDWVIIDTPPLMLLPDAHLLSSIVDGAVLVVKANSTAHEMVKRTADIIGRARVLGVVLNQAAANDATYYGGYYGGYYLGDKGGSQRR
jgi:capsular exopolysaccharide synthesis family protein